MIVSAPKLDMESQGHTHGNHAPLLNAAGVHEPWGLRSIIESDGANGQVGPGATDNDAPVPELPARVGSELRRLVRVRSELLSHCLHAWHRATDGCSGRRQGRLGMRGAQQPVARRHCLLRLLCLLQLQITTGRAVNGNFVQFFCRRRELSCGSIRVVPASPASVVRSAARRAWVAPGVGRSSSILRRDRPFACVRILVAQRLR